MKRLHIIGRKNTGKTTLMVELVTELMARGHRVGTIKHTSHSYELDTPGKDSWRHRRAGSEPAAIVAGGNLAIYRAVNQDIGLYEQLADCYCQCDLVLVEGDRHSTAPTIEVVRDGQTEPPYALNHPQVCAIVGESPCELNVPVWPRADVPKIADNILRMDL